MPAHSTLSTWMLVGPPGKQSPGLHNIKILLYDRTTGQDHLLLPPGKERDRKGVVNYRARDRFTAILLDEEVPEATAFGQLPQPDSHNDESTRLARTFRHAAELSEQLQRVNPGPLPPTIEGLDGVNHFLLASSRIAEDPAGMRVLRHWVQRGGRLWVMLDRVEPEAIAPLLGEALDFQVVDRVGLTTFEIKMESAGQWGPELIPQNHERPVDFVRVLLPPDERVRHTIDGWPTWFMRRVGRGKVVFTTLGPRGLFRDRIQPDRARQIPGDGPSPYKNFPDLPVPQAPLEAIARELLPAEKPFQVEAFKPLLAEEIGYSVVSRLTVGLIFGAFLLTTLGLAILLRRSRRPELLGWLAPAAALGAAGLLLVMGESSRRSVPPTVAVGQVVDAVSGTAEAEV
ncbi:MAG TPA: hypothetical protein VKD72_00100, partial [Gemmataceae bacterium]|nr:hypothetical protein [Gemmataceae bacterium]